MRKDGTLESWDEKKIFEYINEPGPKGTMYETSKQKRIASADIDVAVGYIDECLQDNQGWHRQDIVDPYKVTFPYATKLYKGQEIDCLDTKAVFTVLWVEEKVKRDNTKYKTGTVRLSGPHEPYEYVRLRMRAEDRLVFRKAFPKTMSPAYEFNEDSQLVKNPRSWTDTITYLVSRRMPGSQSGTPFGNKKEIKARYREEIEQAEDKTRYMTIEGQWFDNIVTFEVWSETNNRADALLHYFEDFMDRYTWVFKWNGVQEILYWQRNEDGLTTRWRNDIVHRSVEYFFRSEKIRLHEVRRLVHAALTVDVASRGEVANDLITQVIDPGLWPIPSGVIRVEVVDNTGELIIQY